MNRTWPIKSFFGNQRICPFRIMCIASYPAIVRKAPSAERNHRLAAIRFLMNRWSCFDNVVQILRFPATTMFTKLARMLQFGNNRRVSRVAVDIDHPRPDLPAVGESKL